MQAQFSIVLKKYKYKVQIEHETPKVYEMNGILIYSLHYGFHYNTTRFAGSI